MPSYRAIAFERRYRETSTFDIFEKEIVEDIVKTRIPADWTRDDVYER